ncbi:glucose-1-phosphate adenylyltransferase subunit GlgD [Ligilactobacillus agilis]|uniref:Glucose-1-phosphate adenylyltransferase subunit GlgD n=1 Tax=Ligilactobacillus agilis TaxID=1601 RepID=A0A222W512_9LACO|nr:glucose-1-phosphate adenylyltransferase subunit GlgD [Ligilactobacillus agilis]ASR41257.1 glucose-1-phosphate adenylyltransferase subunit GlgD [Ligilactobacillus agilis]PLA76140.1 glucose-1-phosphate adenylyltransferase subunit GlgD [Ligilactobacillus agilis]PLA83865.1 glucose-1-phosphate adenylyltransferase subunit GlgD [Ligilactobacillus agilis]GET14776.1 glucose-1-phosphate adenylyltransferase [Ligilactobacillus agilis]HJG05157.1 glucose-1-phosphate adenylyltransferase subunit GlgD [Ligi
MKTNRMCAIIGNEHEYTSLLPLTKHRPLSTLYFDCKYRIMDFALSSVVNANIRNVFMIMNEGRIKSVFDHLGGGREWGLDSIGSYQYISFYQDILRRKAEGKTYFDDVIDYLQKSKASYTVFISNKILANVDLRAVLKIHQAQNNKITAVFKRVARNNIASDDQILTLGENGTVLGTKKFNDLSEKDDTYNLAMGIFIANTDWLIKALDAGQNAGAPTSIEEFLVSELTKVKSSAYEYTGYMSNIYSVKSYYQANMDMLNPEKFNSLLFSSQKVITRTKNEVATYFTEDSEVRRSQFATGCVIKGKVEDSLISRRTVVENGAEVIGSVLMGSANVGENTSVKYAILDKNVTIDANLKIEGTPEKPVVIEKDTHVTADVIGG